MPDPNLTYYIDADPIISFEHIYRYPDNLQRKIMEQNSKYYINSKQNIRLNPYYSTKRISNLVLEKLKEKGIVISKGELYAHKEISDLITYIIDKYKKLSLLENNTYDIYISLRTYNSSFFDIKQAISEASRVLKHNSVIMISIANGFLCSEQKYIIPGLILPETEFVDIYRGIDMIKRLATEFSREGFQNIQIFPTNIEIFLTANTAI